MSMHKSIKVDMSGKTDLGPGFIWAFANFGAKGSLRGPTNSKFQLSFSMEFRSVHEFRNVSQSASSQQLASKAPAMRCLRYGPFSCDR